MRKVQEQGKPKKKDGVLEKLLYFDKLFLRAKKYPAVHTFPWCGSPVPIFAYSFRIHHTTVTHSGSRRLPAWDGAFPEAAKYP